MLKELFRATNYIVITFISTHHALEAERLLEGNIEFIVMPTPREISASCGLSLKINKTDLIRAQEFLGKSNVKDYEFYSMVKNGQESDVVKL